MVAEWLLVDDRDETHVSRSSDVVFLAERRSLSGKSTCDSDPQSVEILREWPTILYSRQSD